MTKTIQGYKAFAWAIIALLIASMMYFSFRGYLNAELLLQFANTFHC